MQKLSRKEFEKFVEEGIRLIPRRFLEKLDNVSIVVENEPKPAQMKKFNLRHG